VLGELGGDQVDVVLVVAPGRPAQHVLDLRAGGHPAAPAGVNVNGRDAGARVYTRCSGGGEPAANALSRMGWSSCAIPISSSVLASIAPTQKCRPRQNAVWLAPAV